MKTRNIIAFSLLLGLTGVAEANIIVNIPENCPLKTLNYFYAPIKQYAEASNRAERGIVNDSVAFVDSKAVIETNDNKGGYLYGLNLNDNTVMVYITAPQNITVDVTACNPLQYEFSGSLLMDQVDKLNELEAPVYAKLQTLRANGEPSQEEMEALEQEYVNVQKNFINENTVGGGNLLALMNLNGEDFITIYESLPETAFNNIIAPLAKKQYETEKKNLELEKQQQAMQAGDVDAPNFTLKDLEGKDVSLSDFKGKWVILDFWGSWCPWCIKGFPELKEAYAKYNGELEIIGIDCRESQDDWRAGVAKYELPWVNVYNPEDSKLTSEYGIQGYPTKVIVNPQGKIANITVGHNPSFFTVLTQLMGK